MTKVMNLISAIDQNTDQYNDFILNLLSTHSDLPFDTDEIDTLLDSIISTVNARLNQSITRYDGLNILLKILPRCSKEILLKYASLWISKAMQVLESSQSELREITVACQVLAILVTACKDISELQKQISMQTVKQLVTIISNIEQKKRCGSIFYLLATLMYHYKESSEKLQISLRKLILPIIDSEQKNLIRGAANCFALLTRATERTFKPPSIKPMYTNWIYNQAMICNSLHVIMDDLFSDIMEMETVDVWNKLELPRISEENLFDYYSRLEKRFENLSIFLSTMLRGCGERNSVCPSDILTVLCRGLAITPAILQTDSFKHQMLSLILPNLHINLLMILDAFIDGFRQELMPHANIVLKLYTQTLKWSENVQQNSITISGSKPFKSVRIAIYKSLSLWLTHLSNVSAIDIIADELIPYLLKEITPEKNRVLLTVEKPHNLSKRAMKRFKDSQYENSAVLSGSTAPTEKNALANADLCQNALITLENVIYNSSSYIKPPLYKSIQKLVVSMLFDLYLATDTTSVYRKNHKCRRSLLKVLRAIQMKPHPLLAPPTQYSIEIFNMAMNDENIEIVEEAKISLSEIEKIVRPCAPTLQFPLSNNEHEKNDNLSQSQCAVEVIPINNTQQQSPNINERDGDDVSISSIDNTLESNVQIEKHIQNESMDTSDNENCNKPTPSKQRKVENDDNICVRSPANQKTCEEQTQIIEENTESNSESNLSITQLPTENKFRDDNCDVSESPIKNNIEHNSKNENTIQKLEDNSGDEALLGLFCDELKEN